MGRSRIIDLLWDIRRSLRTRGLRGSIRAARRRLFPPRVTAHPFDTTFGTDTGGLISTCDGDHPSRAHARDYWGTAPSLLRGALARWSGTLAGTGFTVSQYTFIDLGSGKGRAVMLASELPFTACVGVELDPGLAMIARKNLELWSRSAHRCTDLSIVQDDVLALRLPGNPVLLYLFNPFDDHIMSALGLRLRDLLANRGCPIDILYARPEHTAALEALPGATLVWKSEVPFSAEDTAADVFETVQQECVLYRVPPPSSHLP